ncbi:exopolysaccharide Pel transporter PelG [Paenibacillus sp. M1]|uniref:Exopolysaccharide Pel transporter PelG n=1 Tax=Paenibacillus haidiansis TaxID=1574488 RepID=A0ABU7VV72_9BACL
MAGIGFELRKLFREQGLINNVKAYAFSALTTVGPMILSMFLVVALQRMMTRNHASYLDWELYIATVQYAFIFSIIITSGLSMVLTRFIADMIFEKKYDRLLSSYYGALMICLPVSGVAAWLFLREVEAGPDYKLAAYLFFMILVVIWFQSVYLSALKDYMRIVRTFAIGVAAALVSGWLLLGFTGLNRTTAALAAIDIGFILVALLSSYHFEQVFPARRERLYFAFLAYFRKYPSLFFIGTFIYAGIYIHSFVYWFGKRGALVAEQFWTSPFYDLPVFYAFVSVIPTLVTFVVSVETRFYEKFRMYYKQVIEGGTLQEMARAKKEMQRTLMLEISFLMELQLLFTIISLAMGMKLLPGTGFTMEQIDVFALLALGYFLFIIMFVLLHLLMYFDDRKGVLWIGAAFAVLSAAGSYWTYLAESDGLGMFVASFLGLAAALLRLMHVLGNIDYYTFCMQPIHTARSKASSAHRKLTGKPLAAILVLSLGSMLLTGCGDFFSAGTEPVQQSSASASAFASEQPPAKEEAHSRITEDKRIYERDDDDSIKALYVTVLPGKAEKVQDGLNWYALNRITDRYSEENLEVIVQEGAPGGSGPQQGMFGYGDTEANGKISLRGNTARYASQKSYKIRLYDEAGTWLNQRTINLNKHSFDFSRVRNKLTFDLLETIPDITSLRTQFVHLYVKDLSEGAAGKGYENYGLYTQIEQPNEMFLKSHWLDPYGQLYKVAFFEFFRYPDQIKSQSDPAYDKAAFETILEIKGYEDHDKLIAMLDDVNNMSIPIDEVMAKHFDLDNYLTWLAVNILTDNMDTDANNFYLYSPLNSDKWYFLPWDYDGGWGVQRMEKSISDYQNGLSNYWGSVLHNRYFRSEAHIQQLKDKIEEISKYINKETVSRQLGTYEATVRPFLESAPDIGFLPQQTSRLTEEFKYIENVPAMGKQLFLEDLEKPKPFYLDDVETGPDGKQNYSWGLSFDFQGDDLLYDLTVAKDPHFTQPVFEKKDLAVNSFSAPGLPAGTYYWKVVVRDPEGHKQIAFDKYFDTEEQPYYGIREFEVE